MSTKERFPLHDAPGLVRDEVAALTPHVERLFGESPVYVKKVRDEDGSVLERLTEHGYRAARGAEEVALASFALLESATGLSATPSPHHDLLDTLQLDAAKLFGVMSAALAGLQGHPDPCMATWGMRDLLHGLRKRCDSEEARTAARFVYQNPAETPEQVEALVERFGRMDTWGAEAEDEKEAGASIVDTSAGEEATAEIPQSEDVETVSTTDARSDAAIAEAQRIVAAGTLTDYLHDAGSLIQLDGEVLQRIERPDDDILGRLIKRVRSTADIAWAIESNLHPDEKPEWWDNVTGLDGPLWMLPILLMALEYAYERPNVPVGNGYSERWYYAATEAERQGKALVELAKQYASEEVAHA